MPAPTSGTARPESIADRARSFFSWQRGGDPALQALIRIHRSTFPRADVTLLKQAYEVAERCHEGQVRRSGEKYFTHPVAVAQILAELGLDTTTLAAALLHDTVEDTEYTMEVLREEFGSEVCHLVDGVTKLDKMLYGEHAEIETVRKMILAAVADVRVIVIKLADRVHNMRTLGFKSRRSQVRIAMATQEVLVPLADRLGLNTIKRELEDLVLFTLDPKAFAEIDEHLRDRTTRAAHFANVVSAVKPALRKQRVSARLLDRPRHYYSIYQEMADQGAPEPHDPLRLVIIVNGPDTDCYAALGAIHGMWLPVPGRFKDFLASPKFNMYQSLHTTVIGPDDVPLEVLIRTEAMHRVAESGIAAQLSETASAADGQAPEQQLQWLHQLVEWQREAASPDAFRASLRCDLSHDQIMVFTTLGDRVPLPANATPVDLAYTLDTCVGDRLIGSYINGRISPLSSALEDGDVVEIITAKTSEEFPGPTEEWLEFVKSPHAQLQISQWFEGRGDQERGNGLHKTKQGRAAVELAINRQERVLADDTPLIAVAAAMGHDELDSLLLAVADGHANPDEIAARVIASVDQPPLH